MPNPYDFLRADRFVAGRACLPLALPALAHHGWSWTEDGFFELEGIITDIYIGNPHATLDVDVEGEIWRVELAPPSRTIAAGFTEDVAKNGDEVTAIGNRSRDETEKRMKAVRDHRQRQDLRRLSRPRAAGLNSPHAVELLEAIEQLGAVRALKGSFFAYPIVNALHIMSIGAL